MANAQQKPKNKPVAHVRVNLVQASIFENRTDKGVFYNITTDRSYKDQNGEWKRTHSFDLQSLPALEKAVQLAFLKIHELKAQDEVDIAA